MKENCTPSWWCTIFPVGVYLQLLLTSRPRYYPSSAMISKADLFLVPFMCFYLRGCLRFNLDNCCRLDTRITSNNDHRKRCVAPGFKNKTRYTPYVSPGSQISHIAINKGNINKQCSIYNVLSIKNITLNSKQWKDNSDLWVKTPIPQGQLTGWSQA